jgi:hypothetical protein
MRAFTASVVKDVEHEIGRGVVTEDHHQIDGVAQRETQPI